MRRSRALRLIVALCAFTTLGMGALGAEPTYFAETDRVFLGIGCEQAAGGTCATVEYFLGYSAGSSSVATQGGMTPINYLNHADGGDWEYGVFDGSRLGALHLRTDEPVTGQVQLGGWVAEGAASVDATVKVVLTARKPGVGGSAGVVQLGEAEITKDVMTPVDRNFAFSIDLDESLEKLKVERLSLTLYYRGVHVMTNGFVNGRGGSWFDLPTYLVVE